MVEPQNEFSGYGEPAVPENSGVQVILKHDCSETFETDKFNGRCFGKGDLYCIF